MWKSLTNILIPKPQTRLIGVDRIGNRYVEVLLPNNKTPTRQVEFISPDYDPKSIPILWHRWLYHISDQIPTIKDLEDWELNQMILKNKVKKLEEEDNKIREQQIKSGEIKVSGGRKLSQSQQPSQMEFTKVETPTANSQKIISDIFNKTRIQNSMEVPLEMEETRSKIKEISNENKTQIIEPTINVSNLQQNEKTSQKRETTNNKEEKKEKKEEKIHENDFEPPAALPHHSMSFHEIVNSPHPRQSKKPKEIDMKEFLEKETIEVDLNEKPKGAPVLVVEKSNKTHNKNVDENFL